MEYCVKEGNKIVKYEVSYNLVELNRLRRIIIKNCGIREHESYDTEYPKTDSLLVEDYKEKPVGEIEYFEETKTVYHVDYNLIKEPKLSILINRFINKKDVSLLDYLFGDKKLELERFDKPYKKKELLDKLSTMIKDKLDYKAIRKILVELEDLDYQIKLNNDLNLEDQNNYLDQVRNAFTITKIDEIDYDLYNKVINFSKILKKN